MALCVYQQVEAGGFEGTCWDGSKKTLYVRE